MKKYILLFLALMISNFGFCQLSDVTINLTENYCSEPDVLFLDFASTNLVGEYNYRSTDLNCISGELNGVVEITQDPNDESIYFVSDFSFGLFGACFSIDPPMGNLNWKYENFLLEWNGSDNYGEIYMFDSFEFNGSNWTFAYSNSYGDMATVELSRVDGQSMPFASTDPNQISVPSLSFLWSTGETTPSIEISADGIYSVTVSDENGQEKVGEIQISDWDQPHPDFPALVDIYTRSSGSNWIENEGWRQAIDENQGCNPCDGNWFGIECENGNGRVTDIDLANNNLIGEISNEFRTMDDIRSINLSNNQLTGPLPISLTEIFTLLSLDISENELSGSIPVEISESNLAVLDISQNQFTGEIPREIGKNQRLNAFSAFSNQLTGEIPSSLFELPFLSSVILSNNFLEGNLPSNIVSQRLEILSISNNNLSGTIPEWVMDIPFFRLDLSFNNFEGEIKPFNNLSGFTTDLNFAGNNLEGTLPQIPDSIIIFRVNFSYNNFSGEIPPNYFEILSNSSLNLSGNSLTGSIPDNFFATNRIRTLDLSDNNLSGQIPLFLNEIENPLLIDFSNNNFEGCFPQIDSICALGQSSKDSIFTLNNGQSYIFDREAGFDFTNNPKLPWSGSAINFCDGDDQIGAPCDDGDASTTNEAITDDCTCQMATSIHELNGQSLSVYPNPVKDILNIEVLYTEGLNAKLYNSTGQLVRKLNFNIANNISDLQSGIYILEVIDSKKNNSIIEKIIIE